MYLSLLKKSLDEAICIDLTSSQNLSVIKIYVYLLYILFYFT